MLTVWIEAKLKSRKVDFNPNEHQRIQEEFKRIDRELISHKQSDIIRICNNNRPNSDIGFASTIKREKEKKRRHKPIRSLFMRA